MVSEWSAAAEQAESYIRQTTPVTGGHSKVVPHGEPFRGFPTSKEMLDMAKPNGRGGWDITDEEAQAVIDASRGGPNGLIDFLRARLDEDEQVARAARPGYFTPEVLSAFSAVGDARHVVHHAPARVLRKVEANRATLAWLLDVKRVAAEHIPDEAYAFADGLADKALAHLAAEYADHPDYRQEWRP